MEAQKNPFNEYRPTDDGNHFIATLVPLSHAAREELLVRFWMSKDRDWRAFLDGFHYLIHEVIKSRKNGEAAAILTLNEELIHDFIKKTKDLEVNFSFPSGEAFFEAVQNIKPSIFAISRQFSIPLNVYFPKMDPIKSKFIFPETYNDSVGNKCIEIYEASKIPFETVMDLLPALRNSQKVIMKYQNKDTSIMYADAQLAEATFNDIRKRIIVQTTVINEGLPYIYEANKLFAGEILPHKIYNHYMARFLAVKETRFEMDNFLLKWALEIPDYKDPDFTPSESEESNGIKKIDLWKKYKEKLDHITDQLECRYRKRQLNQLLKDPSKKMEVIAELKKIVKRDPIDIRTHILLARLLSDTSSRIKEHAERVTMKEEALGYCESAQSVIDEYLNLQDIKKQKSRDQMRFDFVKTIAAIRIPLVRGNT